MTTIRNRWNFIHVSSAVAAFLLATMVLTSSVVQYATAANSKGSVTPIEPDTPGINYEKLSQAWWEWALSIPARDGLTGFVTNPILDQDGSLCGVAQSGRVWFLAGTDGTTEVTRTCTIPKNKQIFFPVINVVAGDVPESFDEELSRSDAKAYIDAASGLEVTIDDLTITDLSRFRALSPGPGGFDVTLPSDNLFGLPGDFDVTLVSDGYWILLPPLTSGSHTIHFHADDGAAGGVQEVTYLLTVGK